MEWKDWIHKKVFIKLTDGTIFSESIIEDYANGFLYLKDKFNCPAVVAVSQILKIVDEENKEKDDFDEKEKI